MGSQDRIASTAMPSTRAAMSSAPAALPADVMPAQVEGATTTDLLCNACSRRHTKYPRTTIPR